MGGLNVAFRIKKNPAMSHVFVARERALSLVAYHKLSHVTDDFYPHVACQVKKNKAVVCPFYAPVTCREKPLSNFKERPCRLSILGI